jgi:uncharacterized protein
MTRAPIFAAILTAAILTLASAMPSELAAQDAAATECDRYVGADVDAPQHPPPSIDVKSALTACSEALARNPNSARYTFLLGRVYFRNGNAKAAIELYKKAADKAYAPAQNYIGMLYFDGRVLPRDHAQAVAWFRKAADQGLPSAQLSLGLMYQGGFGVPKDGAQAIAWLRKAADKKYAPAQYYLGLTYDRGNGVLQDYSEAMKWYRLAADQKDRMAEFGLGLMYGLGKGVPKNMQEAYNWYRRSAAQGLPQAQYIIGSLYMAGDGVDMDLQRAHMWLNVAASSAAPELKVPEMRDAVAKRLTPAQLTEAQKMAQTCLQSKFQDCGPSTPSSSVAGQARSGSSGTGFFVSEEGHLLTNAHVVDGCREVQPSRGGSLTQVAIDKTSDLALFVAKEKPSAFARIRGGRGARLAESVVAIGFPLTGLLSSDPVVTTGSISALSGMNNDRRTIQISAPIQPGNSGGPVLGENGSVVGMVTAKLNALRMAQVTGDIPQNVNFAISIGIIQSFLNAYAVPYLMDQSDAAKTPADIAAEASNYTVLLRCVK